MKEIKFRAWDKKANSYIEMGFDVRVDGIGYVYRQIWGESQWQRTSDLDIEWSTGLKDKNGKEAYCGDLVDVKDGDYEARGVVEWCNKHGLWLWRATNAHNAFTIAENQTIALWVILSIQHRFKGEIIGNIFQDKELLDETKKTKTD